MVPERAVGDSGDGDGRVAFGSGIGTGAVAGLCDVCGVRVLLSPLLETGSVKRPRCWFAGLRDACEAGGG